LTVSFEHTSKFLDLFTSLCTRFGWSRLIHKVKVGNNVHSIFKSYRLILIEDVQRQAESYFATSKFLLATACDVKIEILDPEANADHRRCFFNRVQSNIIAKAVFQHLSSASIKALALEKKYFTWQDDDGNEKIDDPTLIKIILSKLAPSTVLGVQKLREKISWFELKNFEYNVANMLDAMQGSYDEILSQGGSMDTYITSLFESLLSSSDTVFNTWMTTQQNKYYEDSPQFQVNNLIFGAKHQYNNLVAQWRRNDSVLAALTTRIHNLEKIGDKPTPTNSKPNGG